jgi:ribosomal peptide maturation radical SAM protein 1
MQNADVVLVAMPWMSLAYPSIQLGLLKPVLMQAGLRVRTHTSSLAWAESLVTATASDPDPITLLDYQEIAGLSYGEGLGDWIFAAPFTAAPGGGEGSDGLDALDAEYCDRLLQHGVSPRLLEKARRAKALVPAFIERTADIVLAGGAKAVGFSLVFSQTAPSLRLAKRLKERNPAIRIVCGGASCQGPMGEALVRLCPWIDVVVRGEGEHVAPMVFAALIDEAPVPLVAGVCVRDGTSTAIGPRLQPVALDEVPTPDYEDFFVELEASTLAPHVLPDVVLPFETARGCWWGQKSHCTFCGLNQDTMAFRSKSAASVVADLDRLSRRYRRLDLVSTDNILDFRYFSTLLPALADAGHDFRLFFEVKANMRRDHIRRLRDAGVRVVQPGIETLSTPILKLMRKGVTAIQNVAMLKWCAAYGIKVNWNILVGTPDEPPQDYPRMARLAEGLFHLDPPSISALTLDRFSPFHQDPDRYGLVLKGPRFYYRYVFGGDDAELTDLAYHFDYEYADGRDPLEYAKPLLAVVDRWRSGSPSSRSALSYRLGPDWLVITDRRINLGPRDIVLGELESRLYLACEEIQSIAGACRTAGVDPDDDGTVAAVGALFARLVDQHLMFEDEGRYISLALPSAERLRRLDEALVADDRHERSIVPLARHAESPEVESCV